MIRKRFIFSAMLACFMAGMLFGAASGRGVVAPVVADRLFPQPKPPKDVDVSLLWELIEVLEEKYIDKDKLKDREKLLFGAANGLVRALDDPYTEFFDPDAKKLFFEEASGSFEGIGIEIGIRKDILTVIAPLKGTPADRAGLRAGDKILKIDDASTLDLTLHEAVLRIRGPKGTEVALTILRDVEEPRTIKIARATIDVPVLESEMKEGKIGYVALYNFSENSPEKFSAALKTLLAQLPKGIILDLRNNPGGYLEASVDVAGWFLPKGELVVRERFADGSTKDHVSPGPGTLAQFPVLVLVNEGSASASEIVAGALQKRPRITIMGEKTFGKGSVQEVHELSSKSAVKLTIAKWLTPSGASIQETGITPDSIVSLPDQKEDADKDAQLEKALELLRRK